MSFSAAKAVTTAGRKMFSHSRHTIASSASIRPFLCVRKESQMTRTFARSIWYLSTTTNTGSGSGIQQCQSNINESIGSVTRLRWPTVSQTCSCGHQARLHTEGDKNFSTFLEDEIKLEKDGLQETDGIAGFTLSTDGAIATLSKTKDGETVTVKFNVNHSVEAEPSMDEEVPEDSPPQMRSYPDFTVEISKGDNPSVLSIKCHFTETQLDDEGEILQENDEDDIKDFFLIEEVSIHNGKLTETTYCVGSEVMDGVMYDKLIGMMNERGIDNVFAEKLSNIASTVEHNHYVKFLEELKHIVDC